jgi:hypothetical protein
MEVTYNGKYANGCINTVVKSFVVQAYDVTTINSQMTNLILNLWDLGS